MPILEAAKTHVAADTDRGDRAWGVVEVEPHDQYHAPNIWASTSFIRHYDETQFLFHNLKSYITHLWLQATAERNNATTEY